MAKGELLAPNGKTLTHKHYQKHPRGPAPTNVPYAAATSRNVSGRV